MRGFVQATVGLVLILTVSTEPGLAFTHPLPQLLPNFDYHPYLKNIDGQELWDLEAYLDLISKEFPPQIEENIPPYHRPRQFGSWVRQKSESCLSTRAIVLVRDANDPQEIVFGGARGCRVDSGHWHDPYTDTDIDSAREMQIDHVVALKHAYVNGAYRWDNVQRCHYANFLGYSHHLLAVKGEENMRKGDRSPEEYLPPNSSYVCEYLKVWMTIKATWDLGMRESEKNMIKQTFQHLGCSKDFSRIPLRELASYKDQAQHPIPACERRRNPRVYSDSDFFPPNGAENSNQ